MMAETETEKFRELLDNALQEVNQNGILYTIETELGSNGSPESPLLLNSSQSPDENETSNGATEPLKIVYIQSMTDQSSPIIYADNENDSGLINRPNCENQAQREVCEVIDSDLLDTLKSIDSENAYYLYGIFINHNITSKQVKYLKDYHIQSIIPNQEMGIMAEFQHRFFKWKHSSPASKDLVDNSNYFRNMHASLTDIISSNKSLQSKIGKTDLNEKETKVLLNLIKDHYVNKCESQMRAVDMERISKEIGIHFPGEDPETYFKRNLVKLEDGTEKTKLTGRIVSKWSNRSDKEPAKKRKLAEEVNSSQTEYVTINEIQNETEQKRIQASLKNATKKPLEMILKDWTMCRDIRIKCLIEHKNDPLRIFKEWPNYFWPEGNHLVSSLYY